MLVHPIFAHVTWFACFRCITFCPNSFRQTWLWHIFDKVHGVLGWLFEVQFWSGEFWCSFSCISFISFPHLTHTPYLMMWGLICALYDYPLQSHIQRFREQLVAEWVLHPLNVVRDTVCATALKGGRNKRREASKAKSWPKIERHTVWDSFLPVLYSTYQWMMYETMLLILFLSLYLCVRARV